MRRGRSWTDHSRCNETWRQRRLLARAGRDRRQCRFPRARFRHVRDTFNGPHPTAAIADEPCTRRRRVRARPPATLRPPGGGAGGDARIALLRRTSGGPPARRHPRVDFDPPKAHGSRAAGADRPPQCRSRGPRHPGAAAAARHPRRHPPDPPHRPAQGRRRLPSRERRPPGAAPVRTAPVHAARYHHAAGLDRPSGARTERDDRGREQPRRPPMCWS